MLNREGVSYLQQNGVGLLSAATTQDLYSSPQEMMEIPEGYTSVTALMTEAINKTMRVDTAIRCV